MEKVTNLVTILNFMTSFHVILYLAILLKLVPTGNRFNSETYKINVISVIMSLTIGVLCPPFCLKFDHFFSHTLQVESKPLAKQTFSWADSIHCFKEIFLILTT